MTLFALEKKLRSFHDPRVHFCLCIATRSSTFLPSSFPSLPFPLLALPFIPFPLLMSSSLSFPGPRLLRQLFMGKFLNQQLDQSTFAFLNLHGGVKFIMGKSLGKMRLELSPLFPRYLFIFLFLSFFFFLSHISSSDTSKI